MIQSLHKKNISWYAWPEAQQMFVKTKEKSIAFMQFQAFVTLVDEAILQLHQGLLKSKLDRSWGDWTLKV